MMPFTGAPSICSLLAWWPSPSCRYQYGDQDLLHCMSGLDCYFGFSSRSNNSRSRPRDRFAQGDVDYLPTPVPACVDCAGWSMTKYVILRSNGNCTTICLPFWEVARSQLVLAATISAGTVAILKLLRSQHSKTPRAVGHLAYQLIEEMATRS